MRTILLLLLALLGPQAQAAVAAPICVPGVYGTQFPGSKVVPLMKGAAGWYAYWFCSASDGSPVAEYLICAGSDCPTSWAAAETTLQAMTSASAVQAWWSANATAYSCYAPLPASAPPLPVVNSPQATACVELSGYITRDRPVWTTSPAVMRTPTTGTGALYTTNAGKLTGVVQGRKAVSNTLCACSLNQVISGPITYCALPAPAVKTEVTMCVRTAQ